jgi:hypothetical protein
MTKLKRIAVIMIVTVVIGGIGAKVLYNRVVHGNDARNACIKNLEWIEGAKKFVAQEQKLKAGAIVSQQELEKHMIGDWRICPGGGNYTINRIGTEPTCSVSGHRLER